MKLIPVINKLPNDNIYQFTFEAIMKQSGACLCSLIDAYKLNSEIIDPMQSFMVFLRKLKKELIDPYSGDLYIDSGGYSFIKGTLNENDIGLMIDNYCYYLETARNDYRYIFSLDMPWNIQYPKYNTKEKVHYYNQWSLKRSFTVFEKYPSIADKFFFIWQFRKKNQYQIWNNLYSELVEKGLHKLISCRSIGGMVGIHAALDIKFAPFIPLVFRCFNDYLNAAVFTKDFRIHLLGVYLGYDRFVIAILEILFKKYLEKAGIATKVQITYDSINYLVSTILNSKKLAGYDYEGQENIIRWEHVGTVPEKLLKQIYTNPEHYDIIIDAIDQVKRDKKIQNGPAQFSPLNIHTFNSLDKYFEYIVKEYQFADIFFTSKIEFKLAYEVNEKFKVLQNKSRDIFTDNFIESVQESIEIIFRMHKWYNDEYADEAMLHKLICLYRDKLIADSDELT
ncbi:MAG: hypothetical protein HQK77_15750 [Desulfobacterales bacterium]|nr:hypothetical protein [Desulfobacterales bacterium]